MIISYCYVNVQILSSPVSRAEYMVSHDFCTYLAYYHVISIYNIS